MQVEYRSQSALRAACVEAIAALRVGRAETAERQLRAIQATSPGEINSLHLLGLALLTQGKIKPAIDSLERAVAAAPRFTRARVDLARAYREELRLQAARQELRRALKEAPRLEAAWLAYADVLVDLQLYGDAKFAFEQARLFDPHRVRIEEAGAAFIAGEVKTAEGIFRRILQTDASHLAALCGLAAISLSAGKIHDSERLLRHALKQSARSPLARRGLGHTLLAAGRLPEAESTLRELLKVEPENPQNWVALGSAYTRLLRQADALAAYEEAARLNPAEVRLHLSIGHIHKTLGRREAAERAYHECLRIAPACGEAYWSLADLKTYVFSDDKIDAMRALLTKPGADVGSRAQLHFALARALEQRRQFGESFSHYAAGNALRRTTAPFDMENFERKSRRVAACFDAAFFAERRGTGCPDASPIFIVGLPRSGSTLIEQILASHSRVEGTMELPNIIAMVREFDHVPAQHDGYPEGVRAAPAQRLLALGRRYLEETRPLRSGRAHFIDKMPNNFSHVGLIHAILPRATIIDVRRHPMDACFSTFKQHFAEGQSFSYGLEDLGRYYRCYLALMDHWDMTLPGKVLHLQYEELILNPDASIRRLLQHCGLPFEDACLSFHRTRRPVRTASSEQVRQPLYSSGVGYWKHFARELEPLRRSLGDCIERFADLA